MPLVVFDKNLEVHKGVKIKKLVGLLDLRGKSAQICFFAEGVGALTFEILFCFVWNNPLEDSRKFLQINYSCRYMHRILSYFFEKYMCISVIAS